ncbi:hypothetical protein NOK91_24570 [Vibrio parahaemolyticus]|uniref:hypothetical protein n=1 Tax=Vibrio parahaemolyticus TaxID=670 RepID=UPI00226B634E|nr:hypothetical protein [Vibrio parahaemolyticus]MCX8890326.1 hypothetical protein [Vibrio parahaemolyticus]HCH2845197.1 hypothetical protein [Vibrio parahaemolyticus]
MEQTNIDKYFITVIEAVDLLHKNKFMGQALTIIYSTIDACGLLDAPDSQEKATGSSFKSWVNKYMLEDESLECNADDLWGARCAVLHTHTSTSDLSKANRVREIQYISGPPQHPVVEAFMIASKEIVEGKVVGINVDILVIDFLKAIAKFSNEFSERAKQSEVCQERASKILLHFAL